MENVLYMNAILPYVYLVAIFVQNGKVSSALYDGCYKIIVIQLIGSLIISILAHDKEKIARVNMTIKLIQIPFYCVFFIFAICACMFITLFTGLGFMLAPLFEIIAATVLATTAIPAEVCTIKLKMDKKISTVRMIVYLILNACFCIDVIMAILLRLDYKNKYAPTYSNLNYQNYLS